MEEYFVSFKNNIILNYEARFHQTFFDCYRLCLPDTVKNKLVCQIDKKEFNLCATTQSREEIIQNMNNHLPNYEWFHAEEGPLDIPKLQLPGASWNVIYQHEEGWNLGF